MPAFLRPGVRRRLAILMAWLFTGMLAGLIAAQDPEIVALAIAVVAGAVLLPIAVSHLDWALSGFVFLVPFSGAGMIPGMERTVLPIAGLALGLGWVTRQALRGEEVVWNWQLTLLAGFVGLSVLTSIGGWSAPDPTLGRVSTTTTLATYIQLFGLTFLTAQTVRDARGLRRVAWALALSTGVLAFLLLVSALTPINVPGFEVYVSEGVERVGGLVGGVARTSLFLIIGLVSALFLLRVVRSFYGRTVLLALSVLLTAANLLTVSLTGIVVGALSLALWATIGKGGLRSHRLVFTSILVVALMGTAAALLPTVRTRLLSRIAQVQTQDPMHWLSGRVATWWAGIQVAARHPMGVGPGNVNLYMVRYLPASEFLARLAKDDPRYDPHNTYISIAGDQGLLGLAIFLIVVGGCAVLCESRARRAWAMGDTYGYWLLMMSLVALVSVSAFGLFVSFQRAKYLWLFLGLGMGVHHSDDEQRPRV